MARTPSLVTITPPDFGVPVEQPQVPAAEYRQRVDMARAWAAEAGLEMLVVYGDREHFANLAYLTGYDPRFEESLFLLPMTGEPTLLVGNEGEGYLQACPVPWPHQVYQGFSLLGQPRGEAPRLEPILQACGVTPGMRVGLAGWKYAGPTETDDPDHWLEAPAFIVDALRRLAGDPALVTNATALFMNPVDGLRLINSADQLAAFEFAAAHSSQAVRNLLAGLEPGITELEAVQRAGLNGLPLSAHLMFSTGPRAHLGLPSPTGRVIERGDPFFVGYGLWGGLTARAGFVVAEEAEIPAAHAGYLDGMVKPYFAAVVAWYEALGLFVTGGALFAVVEQALAGTEIRPTLNPGHYIHLDEWVHSPIAAGSTIPLYSGMLLQCDIIPVGPPAWHTTNLEDTVALADAPLREELATRYPELWARVQARRAFMQETLDITLRPEVLPFSNTAAMLAPCALDVSRVLAMR